MKRNKNITWNAIAANKLDLKGKNVTVVGGTGGLGRAFSRLMALRGANVTVVGQTFRDEDIKGISFIKADLSLLSEAERVSNLLPAETLELLVLTTGIMAAPKRQETSEGLERDMAVSFLNRLVLLREIAPRLGNDRLNAKSKPRVFIMGFPGSNQSASIDDLNSERTYKTMVAHINTVIGNEALVLDSAKRYPHINFYGLNPGLIKTNIRSNTLGKDSIKFRIIESLVGLLSQSPETYAESVIPLLFTPEIEGHNGAMFNRKALAIHPSTTMTNDYVGAFIKASEELVNRVKTNRLT